MTLSLFALSGLLIAITSAVMAITMLLRSLEKLHLIWGLFCVTVLFWGLGVFNIANAKNPEDAIFWWKIAYLGVIFIPIIFTHFVHSFLGIKRQRLTWALYIVGVLYLGAMLFTDGFIRQVQLMFQNIYYLSATPLYNSFVALFIALILYSHFLLFRAHHTARGLKKLQIEYFFAGSFIGFVGGSFSFLPVYGINLYPHLNAAVALYPLIMGYAVIRHRLMDVRIVVRKAVNYLFLMTFAYAAFYFVAITYEYLWGDPLAPQGFIAGIFVAMAFAFALPRFQNLTRHVANRYLYAGIYDTQKTIEALSRKLTSIISFEQLIATIVQAIQGKLGVTHVQILLRKGGIAGLQMSDTAETKLVRQVSDNEMTDWFLSHQDPLVQEEIELQLKEMPDTADKQRLAKVQKKMEWFGGAVYVPLFAHDELIGVMAIGKKRNSESFYQEDLNLLRTIAAPAAVALENARLYQESLEFGKKLEQEVNRATHDLELANRQLRDLDKAKSEFLSIASHQLYTPLTAIRGYLSMLREEDFGKLDKQQAPIIDVINKSAERLIDLIKNLLDISRIESGRLELDLHEISLVEMAKEIVQDLMPNAMTKNLKLEFQKSDHPIPNVVADKERLRQVVLNFVDNAIKYTDTGRIEVSVEQVGNEVVLRVTDTGKGLSQEEIAKLFTKFTRAGDASHYHTEGTGLGLYVARQIIREHRGEVDVMSPGKGQGSTFSMRMPAAGTPHSLKLGDKATVIIKAAEASGAIAPNKAQA